MSKRFEPVDEGDGNSSLDEVHQPAFSSGHLSEKKGTWTNRFHGFDTFIVLSGFMSLTVAAYGVASQQLNTLLIGSCVAYSVAALVWAFQREALTFWLRGNKLYVSDREIGDVAAIVRFVVSPQLKEGRYDVIAETLHERVVACRGLSHVDATTVAARLARFSESSAGVEVPLLEASVGDDEPVPTIGMAEQMLEVLDAKEE